MKIAIYGGSFNPPHLGHLNVVKAIKEYISPDRFFIIPAFIPPHKAVEAGSPSPEQRMEMCRIAFGQTGAEISDIEFQRGGKSYTVDTLAGFRTLFPDDEFFLVIGSDSFLDFEKWFRFEDIMKQCTLAAVSRANGDLDTLITAQNTYAEKYGCRSVIVPAAAFEVSSTEIRHGILSDDKLSPSVLEYIKQNRLYTNLQK